MRAARAAARAADAARAASAAGASCSGRAEAGSLRRLAALAGASAASAAPAAAAAAPPLPLAVRLALAELRAAAARASRSPPAVRDAGCLAAAVKNAVLRSSPLAAMELGRAASAACYAVQPSPPVRRASAALALALPRSPAAAALHASHELVLTALRVVHLSILFAPLLFSAPLCLLYGLGRDAWMELLNRTLRAAGPAFIKWGQWAATRADLFPPDMCHVLTSLQSDAPSHSWKHTRREVEAAFGQPLEALFLTFDEAPVASGSIAQVHRATLRHPPAAAPGEPAPPAVVAVKVRHPDVAAIISRDFVVLRVAAEIAGMVPGLSWMRLDESVRQFREPLFEQVDLTREAENLRLFNANFASWRQVSFPKPVEHLVRPAVLVESFEEGSSITGFLQSDDPQVRRVLADLGCKALLKMMLSDNFVHADLHPGNILVRMDAPVVGTGLLGSLLPRRLRRPRPHIVLLDCGMTATLSDRNKHNLYRFFEAITRGDGRCVAETALAFSEHQTCPRPQAFVDDLVDLFSTAVAWGFDVNTSEWMAAVLESVRRHQVHLASEVCSVVVTALVLEGWSNRLDPDICIMEQIRQIVFGGDRLKRRLEDLAKLL